MTTSTRDRVRDPAPAARTVPGQRSGASDRIEGLDGLRALAIIAVLLFHLDAAWLPGGFLGVDVFFVVSGFLITTLLLREKQRNGRIALRDFWVRRARRLLPALALTVVVSVLIARLVSSDLLVHVGRQVVGALTFSTNWLEIAAGASYFDQTAPTLFMNFWSLAVEEQFYLFWPFAVIGLLLLPSVRARIVLVAGLGLASAALMAAQFSPGTDTTRIYYGTDTHLMGLMAGAALAFAWSVPEIADRLRPSRLGTPGRFAVPVATAVLLGCFLLLDESSPFTYRFGFLLVSLATVVLLVGVMDRDPGRPRTVVQVLADHPVAAWIGVRSYAIYLWHWPVILIVGLDNPSVPGTSWHLLTRAWCLLVTLALADLTHRFVETPFRRLGFGGVARRIGSSLLSVTPRTRQIVAGSAAALAVTLAVVVLTAPDRSETARILEANAAAAEAQAAVPSTAPTPTESVSAPTTPTGTTPKPTASAGGKKQAKATADFSMPKGTEIDGYGDSMMVGSIHALPYYFPGIRMDAKSNRQWSDGLAAVKARGKDNRRAVVLAFGTNAGVQADDVEKVLDVLGPDRMVVLVNLMAQFSRIEKDNRTLAEIAAKHDNVVVADWAAAVRNHPDQLQSDRIHPSLRGSHLFAKTVRAALAELSEAHTGVTVDLPDLPMP